MRDAASIIVLRYSFLLTVTTCKQVHNDMVRCLKKNIVRSKLIEFNLNMNTIR